MHIIDISVALQHGLVVWPRERPLDVQRVSHVETGGANVSELCLSSHTGTHVDPPLHFVAGGRPVDQLPLDVLVGPADVLDLTHVSAAITAADLETARLPADCRRLLLHTRNSQHWERADTAFDEGYVGLAADAAAWVVARGIQLVGIDYLSIEPFNLPGHPVHHTLLQAQVVILETLNLTGVAAGRYQLLCLPLRIAGGDGAPARAVLATLGYIPSSLVTGS
ncbi:MAG TPA: cyclase family protein [Anaerolineae bacterium]|nr:cyclase family protein [Anaerolineae bacterium]HPL26645.1 cyclase family protein [Anaerolineae bacterium]